MRDDFWRFFGVLVLSLVFGIITKQVLVCLLIGCLFYIYWQNQQFKKLLSWLQSRKYLNSPESSGLIDAICREIDYTKIQQKRRSHKLADYLKRFQDASMALPDAIVILGEYGVIEWANTRALDYLGIRWPQDNSQRINNLIRHPEIKRFLSQKGLNKNRENLQMESPVNPELTLEFRVSAYGDKHKLLIARDITGIQRINQMRKDFIANASHELRTPLTVISGYLESFSSEDNFPDEFKSQILQMCKQSERMQRLIEDLLTLSSLESSERINQDDVIRVPELLALIYQEAEVLSGVMTHIFYLETDTDLWLQGSQRELYSAFSNLVFNAVQYTPENGIIRIRWYMDHDEAIFEVIDNGPGIPPEHISRITERFYRIDKGRSRERGGTGLGLAIVKHVVARHQGKLEIESQVGKGSKFRCRFPNKIIINHQENPSHSMTA